MPKWVRDRFILHLGLVHFESLNKIYKRIKQDTQVHYAFFSAQSCIAVQESVNTSLLTKRTQQNKNSQCRNYPVTKGVSHFTLSPSSTCISCTCPRGSLVIRPLIPAGDRQLRPNEQFNYELSGQRLCLLHAFTLETNQPGGPVVGAEGRLDSPVATGNQSLSSAFDILLSSPVHR